MNNSKERRFNNDRMAFIRQLSAGVCELVRTISSAAANVVMSTTSWSARAMPNASSSERTRFRWARLSQLAVLSRVLPERGPGSVQKISAKIFSSRRTVSSIRSTDSHPRLVEDVLGRRLDDGSGQAPPSAIRPFAFERAQKSGRRGVLSRVDKPPGHARPAGRAAQVLQGGGLDSSTEGPAAQHELLKLGASMRPDSADQHQNRPEVSGTGSTPGRKHNTPA